MVVQSVEPSRSRDAAATCRSVDTLVRSVEGFEFSIEAVIVGITFDADRWGRRSARSSPSSEHEAEEHDPRAYDEEHDGYGEPKQRAGLQHSSNLRPVAGYEIGLDGEGRFSGRDARLDFASKGTA